MFFQVFKDDILEFPSSLIANVNDIPGILCDCKSGNTVRNYYCGFLRWKKMSKLHWISDGDVLPAKPIHVVLYLTCLMQHNSRSGPINQAFYSIRWVHYIVSVLSPTGSFSVRNILEGAKRRLAVPSKRKNRLVQN
jgi:hypothetical protein